VDLGDQRSGLGSLGMLTLTTRQTHVCSVMSTECHAKEKIDGVENLDHGGWLA